jgi:integrating conjugative element protein (TIGR03757 family)
LHTWELVSISDAYLIDAYVVATRALKQQRQANGGPVHHLMRCNSSERVSGYQSTRRLDTRLDSAARQLTAVHSRLRHTHRHEARSNGFSRFPSNPVSGGFSLFAADDYRSALHYHGPLPSVISMSASRMIPASHTPRSKKVLLAGSCTLSLSCAIAAEAEILVVTDREHPVIARPAVRVIELDAPVRIVESELTAHLPADPRKAEVIARQRLGDGGAVLQKHLAATYQGVIDALTLGITKIPAVVVDRRYVVYGERDVNRAASLIARYRSAQQ